MHRGSLKRGLGAAAWGWHTLALGTPSRTCLCAVLHTATGVHAAQMVTGQEAMPTSAEVAAPLMYIQFWLGLMQGQQ